MPMITASFDPVTRIEGHMKVNVTIDTAGGAPRVAEAESVGTLFRGFERLLAGRDPRDATILTSRICGVCPTAHALTAARALDQAAGLTIPPAGRLLRNLVHAACFIESHLLHFYLLCLPDYIEGLPMAPWAPGWRVGRRLDGSDAATLRAHYLAATDARRRVHEMAAIFGGKLPHTPAFIAGGFTAVARAETKDAFAAALDEVTAFIRDVYLPDVDFLAASFPDYFSIGRGFGHLLSYGAFDLDAAGAALLMERGRIHGDAEAVLPLDMAAITEDVTHAWYEPDPPVSPAAGRTAPQHPKTDAYSWIKAPRYAGESYECGPLSRMRINGDYAGGVSVMDRHLARALEAGKLAAAMRSWLNDLPENTSAYTPYAAPADAAGIGLTEAPRGALGHWVSIAGGRISRYQIITPTCWNAAPRDGAGVRGPLEQALVGTPVAVPDQPIEVLRVIHSFDPCLDCATHVIRLSGSGVRTVWTPPAGSPRAGKGGCP